MSAEAVTTPFVSVIVATRNRQDLLARTIEALGEQSWPANRFELVIADNGSTDGTRAVVESAAARLKVAVRYLFVAQPGKSYAVNEALAVARGEILAFTDDDVRPSREWIAAIVAAMEDPRVDFLAGRIKPMWEIPPPRWMSSAMNGVLAIPDNGDQRIELYAGGESGIMPIGANMAVRQRVVHHVGGLHTDLGKLEGSFRTGEDHEFFLRLLRAGHRGVYEPRALVHHWVPASRLQISYCRRWLYQNGRDVAQLTDIYPEQVPYLLGIPRYLWRNGASDMVRAARGLVQRDPATRLAATTRLGWLTGYVQESWFGKRQ